MFNNKKVLLNDIRNRKPLSVISLRVRSLHAFNKEMWLYSRVLEGGQSGQGPLDFEMRHFPITFLAKKLFS